MKRYISAFFLLFFCTAAWATNSHQLGSEARERMAWWHDAHQPYVASGCQPAVPSSSLTIASFACAAYVSDGTDELVYVLETAAITIADATPTWLAICQDRSSTVTGWTRQGLTHFVYKQSASQPTNPNGCLVFSGVAVAGSVITTIDPVACRNPSDCNTANVVDFGAVSGGTASSNTTAFQAAADYIDTLRTSFQPTGGSFLGATHTLIIPGNGRFQIDDTITIGAYTTVDCPGKAIIEQTTATKKTFYFPEGYLITIKGCRFLEGPRALVFDNANIDSTQILLDNIEVQLSEDSAVHLIGKVFASSPTDSTTLNGAATAGNQFVTVADTTGFTNGEEVMLVNDLGDYDHNYVDSISGTGGLTATNLPLRYPIPSYWSGAAVASSGNAVKTGNTTTSAQLIIRDSRFIRNGKVMNTRADRTIFKDSWVYVEKASAQANAAQFINHSELYIDGMFGVPEVGTQGVDRVAGVRWIDNYGAVEAKNSRFGGEDAGMSIVWNYSNPASATPWINTASVVLETNQMSIGPDALAGTGGQSVVHIAWGVPQIIRIVGNRQLTRGGDIITVGTLPAGSLAAHLAALDPLVADEIFIEIHQNYGFPSFQFAAQNIPDEFIEYLYVRPTPLRLTTLNGQTAPAPRADTFDAWVDDLVSGGSGLFMQDEGGEIYAIGASGIGKIYTESSNDSAGTSIIDTGLTLDDIGASAMYLLQVTGNPTPAGSSSYRDAIFGIVHIDTGNTGTVETEITFTSLSDHNTTGINDLTVSVTFWDGGTEDATVTPGAAGQQIRIKIAGYTAGSEASSQRVRLMRIL